MDDLTQYEQARYELRKRLAGKFPADFDLDEALTAYAYWVCTVVNNRGKDWQAALQEYADKAVRDALVESRAEQIELDLLRQALQPVSGPLLDVGAGWGRFRAVYRDLGLEATYVEPYMLGCRLLRRNGLDRSLRCLGQRLAFPARTFSSAVVGWVLHHDSPDVPCAEIVKEVARVLAPGGHLISIEPLSTDFDANKWRALMRAAGLAVARVEIFFEFSPPDASAEQYAFLSAIRTDEPVNG